MTMATFFSFSFSLFFFFFFFKNSLAYARVTQHCALSRSPQPNTTNYFLREEAACRRATPPGVRAQPLVALRGLRTREGRRALSSAEHRPPTPPPATSICRHHRSASPELCDRCAQSMWRGCARPGGGARGAEPCPAARLLAPAAQTSHLAADSCGTPERNIRPDNWRRKVKRV